MYIHLCMHLTTIKEEVMNLKETKQKRINWRQEREVKKNENI